MNCDTSVFTDVMNANPLRYRGYIYDEETGFYYLQSRYYDPEVGRFINIDGQFNGGLVGNNLYSYCENDPVNYFDPNGEFAVSAIIIGTIIGLAIGFGATAYVDYADDGRIFNGSVSTEGYVLNTIVGGIVGAFTGGVGSSTFTFSIPSLALLETTIGTLEPVVGTTTVTVNGLIVAGVGIVSVSAIAKKIGQEGGRTPSTTTWRGVGKERIDVENHDPGIRDGQIHYHEPNNKKHMYDFKHRAFQERVDELGDASVPFKFDVHSFIFSDNAVDLETALHKRLSNKRVNKVNMRKEFFYSSIDELEALVAEIAPTAEFTKTMLAEEFRQSQSTQEVYSTNFVLDEDEDEYDN